MDKVNIWAIMLAAFSYLIIGSLWYSPLLFGKLWIRLIGFCDEDFKTNKPMWMIMTFSFLSAAIAALVISAVLGPRQSADFGAIVGAIIAVCWISMSKLYNVLFENQPIKLFFSDAIQLAKSTDGILLVARLLYSSKTGLKEYVEDTVFLPGKGWQGGRWGLSVVLSAGQALLSCLKNISLSNCRRIFII